MRKIQLANISVYPVKSASGIELSTAWVEKIGLSFDRRFMVADSEGKMVTGRTQPELSRINITLQADGITLSHAKQSPLILKYSQFSMTPVNTHVWKDEFAGFSTTEVANTWLSHLLGLSVQLLFTGDTVNGQQSPRFGSKAKVPVSFADGFPALIISEASLAALNERSPVHHQMSQFRTNLVATGCEPFEEDSWQKIRIGSVEFMVDCPCSRCVFTTLDPKTGEFRADGEPITTLSQFRSDGAGKVNFGMNLIALNDGEISVDDQIVVLERRTPETYEDNTMPKLTLTCTEVEPVSQGFQTFWLESESRALPDYRAGQHLPIELLVDGEHIQRRYTLSSSPTRPERLGITVKRVNDGLISNWLHDNFKVGSKMITRKPEGQFHLSDNEAERESILFLSAGSGVTPMMSMLRSLSDSDEVKDVVFYHQSRSEADLPFTTELKDMADKHSGLAVMTALSQPSESWNGLSGRLSQEQLSLVPNLANRQVYVCGPQGFMEQAMSVLETLGVPESQRHQEFFSPVEFGFSTQTRQVSVTVDGEYFRADNQRPILIQAEEAGLSLDYSCRAGVCGCCKMRLVEGDVNQPDMPALYPGEKEDGLILACCCVPEGDVTLTRL